MKVRKYPWAGHVLLGVSIVLFVSVTGCRRPITQPTSVAKATETSNESDSAPAEQENTAAPDSTAKVTVTGELGSPSATTTIPGNRLPAPDPKFGGEIKNDALTSKPWWPPRIVPPKEAPNVLLIITDDAGFGVPSTFGGVIPTPTMDRIANAGLQAARDHFCESKETRRDPGGLGVDALA